MSSLSLTACSFHIKEFNSRSKEKVLNLNDVIEYTSDDGGTHKESIYDLFKTFFNYYSESISDDNRSKTFNCTFKNEYLGENGNYTYLYVLIKSGNYGSSSEIKNIETKEITYKKMANESEEKPFYLFIVIPKDSSNVKVQKGIFIFQNVGPYGVKTITTEYMKSFFSDKYKVTLKCKTIAPKLFLEKFIKKENLLKIILTKNHKSSDSADNIKNGYGVETRTLANLSFTESLWQNLINKIKYFTSGKYNLFEFENQVYDGLKVLAIIGDRPRTVDLHNIENLSIIEGIPDEIKGFDGHPQKNELIIYLMRVADEYLKEMVLSIE